MLEPGYEARNAIRTPDKGFKNYKEYLAERDRKRKRIYRESKVH